MKSSGKRPRINKEIDTAYRENEGSGSSKPDYASPVDRLAESRFSGNDEISPKKSRKITIKLSDDKPNSSGSGRKIVVKKRDEGKSSTSYPGDERRTSSRGTRTGDDRPARFTSSGNDRKPASRIPKTDDDRRSRTSYSLGDDQGYRKPASRGTRTGDDRPARFTSSGDDRKPASRIPKTDDDRRSRTSYSSGDDQGYRKPASRGTRTGDDRPARFTSSGDDRKPASRRPKSDDSFTFKSKKNMNPDLTGKGEYSPKATFGGGDKGNFKNEGRKGDSKFRRDRKNGNYSEKPEHRKERLAKSNPFNQDGPQLIRLNRFLSISGVCSRREADELIQAGVVSVNGVVVTELGSKVLTTDHVVYGGESLKAEKLQYLLLNKPKGYLTTTEDPDDRKTVMSLIEDACSERVYPVGRLDRNTTGLLLLTNDGELAKKLMHPKFGIKKVYQVTLDKNLRKEDMLDIINGIELDGEAIKVDDIAYVGASKKEIGIELHSGQNRVVRRIFESFNYDVVKLDRTMYAGLTKKDLPRGRWRFLSQKEVSFLKMIK